MALSNLSIDHLLLAVVETLTLVHEPAIQTITKKRHKNAMPPNAICHVSSNRFPSIASFRKLIQQSGVQYCCFISTTELNRSPSCRLTITTQLPPRIPCKENCLAEDRSSTKGHTNTEYDKPFRLEAEIGNFTVRSTLLGCTGRGGVASRAAGG